MKWLSASLAICVGIFGLAATPDTASAAKSCIHEWAVPGQYTVAGNFRGSNESASARLTRDCRLFFQVPGVFSGGRVKADGECVSFSFKVDGAPKAFRGKWCNTYGVVPWNGRLIRASVRRDRLQ